MKVTIVPTNQLPYIDMDCPQLKEHREKTRKMIESPQVQEFLRQHTEKLNSTKSTK